MQNLKNLTQVYWNIRWLRRLVIGITTLFIFLLLMPIAIQLGIPYLLKEQGATAAHVEDINLNLFAGSFELTNLTMQVADNDSATIGHIYTNINMLDLIGSKIVIDEISLADIKAKIYRDGDGRISVNGLKLGINDASARDEQESDPTTSEPLAFAVNKLLIQQLAINYREPDFDQQLAVSELTLKHIKSWDAQTGATLDAAMTLNQSPVKISATLKLFDKIRTFKGQASMQAVAFTPFAKYYRDYLTELEGQLSLSTQFDLAMDEHISGQLENKVDIEKLNLQYQHIRQENDLISWQGTTQLMAENRVETQGQLQIENNQTTDTEQNYKISSFSSLDIQAIQYTPEKTTVDKIMLNDFILTHLEEQQSLLNLSKLEIEKVDFQPLQPSVQIKQVSLSKPLLQVTLDENKQLTELKPLVSTLDAFSQAQTINTVPVNAPKQANKALQLNIGKLYLTEPGKLDFTDLSVNPDYKTTVYFNNIEIDNLSSTDAADFNLALKQGDYTTLDIKGSGLLMDPTQQMSLKAHIKQLDLPPVTSYTSATIGYGMKSGVIDSDIDVKISKREIDSLVDLKIDSIEVVETQAETAQQVTSASGMSIDLAVSTLKDDNNIIDLKLPVKGNLDQPDFDLSLVINKALGKAMQSASLSYLKYALQPFGSLVSLFNLAKAAAEHISLPPIVFKTNSLEFEDKQQELLEKVVNVLKERPALKIKACGVSSLADQIAIKEQLVKAEVEKQKKQQKASEKKDKKGQKSLPVVIADELVQQQMKTLADDRAAKVKAYFLQKGNLKSNRILNCLSSSNTEKESLATVELQI